MDLLILASGFVLMAVCSFGLGYEVGRERNRWPS